MIKFLKVLSATLVAASLLMLPKLAQAEDGRLTLRVEPGIAVAVTEPQSSRFGPGGYIAVKPEVTAGHYFGFGPSLSVVALSSSISGIDTGTAFGLGGFFRVKRPHDEKNTGSGLSAVSPWVDADVKLVATGPLDRFGWSVGGGLAVPTSEARNVWIGPFVRYESVFQADKPGFNSNSAKIVVVGLSFEFGASAPKKVAKVPCPPVEPVVVVVVTPVPTPTPDPAPVPRGETTVEYKQTVQFAWDSPVLDDTATSHLNDVVKQLTSSNSFEAIKIEGHASSEGTVEHNDVLSLNRAKAVVDFLVTHGVPREKLSATGFGSRVPVATNSTEAGRVLNRRSEFVVKFVVVNESK